MVALGLVALIVGGGPARAAPAPAPSGAGGQVAVGKKACTAKDQRLRELSGMIATAKGYIVINDSTDDPGKKPVFFLDKTCRVVDTVSFPTEPRDPEDLALSPDGKTVWIGDIGDNATATERRTRVALWSMPVDGSTKPVLHRVSYPQNKPHDAEALLIADDGSPIIITKTGGKAEIFRPSAPLKKNNETPVPLQQVGEITLPKTSTTVLLGAAGRLTVTGAARSPDGARVALRTYADAFEWDVAGGDIVKALTTGKPRVTALGDEFGEAIAYTPDGKTFVTVSDLGSQSEDSQVVIQSYTPATTLAQPAADAAAGKADGQSWTDKLTLQDINYLVGAVGVIGAILVGVGIFGIVRARRTPRKDPAGADGDSGGKGARSAPSAGVAAVRAPGQQGSREPGPDADAFEPAGQRPRPSAGVYGGGAKPVNPAAGVYGGAAAAPRPGGGVYGGAAAAPRPGGGVYGGAAAPNGAGAGALNGAGPARSGGVYGAAPSGRRPGPAAGGYGAEPVSGGYGRDDRPDEDHRRGGRGAGYPPHGRGDEDDYDGNRAGTYGQQPPGRRGGYPDNGDGYR